MADRVCSQRRPVLSFLGQASIFRLRAAPPHEQEKAQPEFAHNEKHGDSGDATRLGA